MGVLDNGDSERATCVSSREYSPVDCACHSVVVSLSCACERRPQRNEHEYQRDGSPATCIGLGSRNSKGVTSSREAKALSSARTRGNCGRSQGFPLQQFFAMFQSSIIFGEMSSGTPGRSPLNTASGTSHDCLIPSKGFLPDKTYGK